MIQRLGRLIFGLALYSIGIVLTINADIGYAPWDVLHVGLGKTFGISIGLASIAVGLIVVLVAYLFKEKMGLGTLLNMLLIGVFIDAIFYVGAVPKAVGLLWGVLYLLAGLLVISFASYFYIGSGFGAGPRDSLMVLLAKKLKTTVGFVRTGMEISVVLIGWLLGGAVGIGTVLSSFLIGLFIHAVFKMLKFDPKAVKHQTLQESFKAMLGQAKP